MASKNTKVSNIDLFLFVINYWHFYWNMGTLVQVG